MPTPSKNSIDGGEGKSLGGAPFPPRPKAIATFISSMDFLPGCQTLLHSVKTHLAPTTPQDPYPPEIIVLLSSQLLARSDHATKINNHLLPKFCDRVIIVNHISIAKDAEDGDNNGNEGKPSHVRSWDENCGWTKLRLFELEGYDKILYIDADCLVVKDVGHLLRVDEDDNGDDAGNDSTREKRVGLLAAAPDIFPPDKFNAGVMVIRPSKAVFEDMMACLPNSTSSNQMGSRKTCTSYDGGDTGFLNSFYPGWYNDMPSYSRLPFGYNAQRFMHHCTYDKQPKYWDQAIDDIRIIHFSSSPKPWEKKGSKSSNDAEDKPSYLDGNDANSIQKAAEGGELESMWQKAYENSQAYILHHDVTQKAEAAPARAKPQRHAPAAAKASPQNTHRMVQNRYKELRKTGMNTKEAMLVSRAEYGLDKEGEIDPGKAVGQMFGLM
ncbi:hypothetical protein ACHAXR_010953 [Thalassiosira sp. AJA248-18]